MTLTLKIIVPKSFRMTLRPMIIQQHTTLTAKLFGRYFEPRQPRKISAFAVPHCGVKQRLHWFGRHTVDKITYSLRIRTLDLEDDNRDASPHTRAKNPIPSSKPAVKTSTGASFKHKTLESKKKTKKAYEQVSGVYEAYINTATPNCHYH